MEPARVVQAAPIEMLVRQAVVSGTPRVYMWQTLTAILLLEFPDLISNAEDLSLAVSMDQQRMTAIFLKVS
jgi:hypothetical protein